MNIVNAWNLPRHLSIWTNVDAKNVVGARVQGEFDVLQVLCNSVRMLQMRGKVDCCINKLDLYNILEVYNKEFSEYSESFKKYERG